MLQYPDRDKAIREALKDQIIKLLDEERSSICRRAHMDTMDMVATIPFYPSKLTEEQKDTLNKIYAYYDNYVEFFQSQDF